jgi:hypothetical protein
MTTGNSGWFRRRHADDGCLSRRIGSVTNPARPTWAGNSGGMRWRQLAVLVTVGVLAGGCQLSATARSSESSSARLPHATATSSERSPISASDKPELGIVEEAPAFYTGVYPYTLSHVRWQAWADREHRTVAMVYTAYSNRDPKQGYVIVQLQRTAAGNGAFIRGLTLYRVGRDAGKLTIISATASQLRLRAADGQRFTFDLLRRAIQPT